MNNIVIEYDLYNPRISKREADDKWLISQVLDIKKSKGYSEELIGLLFDDEFMEAISSILAEHKLPVYSKKSHSSFHLSASHLGLYHLACLLEECHRKLHEDTATFIKNKEDPMWGKMDTCLEKIQTELQFFKKQGQDLGQASVLDEEDCAPASSIVSKL